MLLKSVAGGFAVVNGAGLWHTMDGLECTEVHAALVQGGVLTEFVPTGLGSIGSLGTTAVGMDCGLALRGIFPEFAAEYLYILLLVMTGIETGNRELFMTGDAGVITLIFQIIPELVALNLVTGLILLNGLNEHATV